MEAKILYWMDLGGSPQATILKGAQQVCRQGD
jgi:hypothetical protein